MNFLAILTSSIMEVEAYRNVTSEMVAEASEKYFRASNCSTVYYKSARKES